MSEEYVYAVARVRGKELTLLNQQTMDVLMAAKSYEEALRLLSEHGWENSGSDAPEVILKREREKTWGFVSELVKKDLSVFHVFLYANDFHNLKAAIKESVSGRETPGVYMDRAQCVYDPALIQRAVREREYGDLPPEMRAVAKEALETLLHTGDGQLTDVIVDQAALTRIYEAGGKSENATILKYAEITVAAANIRTAVRGCLAGKDANFLLRAFAPCKSLNVSQLAKAAADSTEAIYEYLEHTAYAKAVPEIRKSTAAFERWCDNEIIAQMRPELHNPFTVGPIAAFIVARENEIKTVRIILSGKRNLLPDEAIRERVRETYV